MLVGIKLFNCYDPNFLKFHYGYPYLQTFYMFFNCILGVTMQLYASSLFMCLNWMVLIPRYVYIKL